VGRERAKREFPLDFTTGILPRSVRFGFPLERLLIVYKKSGDCAIFHTLSISFTSFRLKFKVWDSILTFDLTFSDLVASSYIAELLYGTVMVSALESSESSTITLPT